MADIILKAETRTEFGKGAARRIRRADRIPAVLYGHGIDPIHLHLPGHETFLALRGHANALLTLEFDGRDELALARDIQRDPVKRTIDHVDFVLIRRGEKVSVEIAVVTEGEPAPGTVASVDLLHVGILVDATQIPESIVVDVTDLEDGTVVRAEDLTLPKGAELEIDGDTSVISVAIPAVEADPENEGDQDDAASDSANAGSNEA